MKTIFSIILILLAGGLFYFYTNPQYQNVKALEVEQANYNTALTQSKKLIAQRQTLTDEYNQIPGADLDRIQKLVPNSVDNVRLIIDMNGIALNRGLTIRNIKISGGQSGGATLGPDSNPYGSMELSFTVTASYDTFQQFLQDLEGSLRIVDVDSLSFTSTDKSDQYDYNVSLRTYWLK